MFAYLPPSDPVPEGYAVRLLSDKQIHRHR